MRVLEKLRDLDRRGPAIQPRSGETRTDYLTRVAGSGRGTVGSAVAVLAREVLDQRRQIAELEARLSRLENAG